MSDAYVVSLNLHRRHLSTSQRAMIAARREEYHAVLAKERSGGRPKKGVANLPQVSDAGKARDKAGKELGVSGRTVSHAKKVLAHGAKARTDSKPRHFPGCSDSPKMLGAR